MSSVGASGLDRLRKWRILQPVRPLLRALRNGTRGLRRSARQSWWQRLRGRPPIPPPHEYKVRVILDYARRFHIATLVETGTYLGDTIEATRAAFERVWSIELDDSLFEAATRRFNTAENVTIIHGDSARLLPEVLAKVNGPTLFWLDGHFSGGMTARGDTDTPIGAELQAVLARPGMDDVVLIDDARDFGVGDYPSIASIASAIAAQRPGWAFEVRDDIMRAHARHEGGRSQ